MDREGENEEDHNILEMIEELNNRQNDAFNRLNEMRNRENEILEHLQPILDRERAMRDQLLQREEHIRVLNEHQEILMHQLEVQRRQFIIRQRNNPMMLFNQMPAQNIRIVPAPADPQNAGAVPRPIPVPAVIVPVQAARPGDGEHREALWERLDALYQQFQNMDERILALEQQQEANN